MRSALFNGDELLGDGYGSGALLVTAHPDDEVLFFSPTIIALRDRLALHVLCLSTGNFDGLGAVRSAELIQACTALGVPAERVSVKDDTMLQDGPQYDWPVDRVASIVRYHLAQHKLQRVITFDWHGISGHPNHIACQRGVLRLLDRDANESGIDNGSGPTRPQLASVYMLQSVGMLRHYMSFVDMIVTIVAVLLRRLCGGPTVVCCVSLTPWACHTAMRFHASQYVWFRRLYVLLSRYVHVNTLERAHCWDVQGRAVEPVGDKSL